MATHAYYVPPVNLMGRGCLQEAGQMIEQMGIRKALVVSDRQLITSGVAEQVLSILRKSGLDYVVYDEVQPNPTCQNVHDGLQVFQDHGCDAIISIGGGSPQDAAKGIGIVATNGGHIREYEGFHQSKHKSVPLVAVNTTAGTSSEVTINYVITDEERKVKMVMVDRNSLVSLSVNDPELMLSKPASLTAATGMDALTHAVEAMVTPGGFTVTSATAAAAVELIFEYLPRAVRDGSDLEAREHMTYACFLGGIAFNNAGLGYVHAMAHQLGGVYDLPHGVCNAMLLPYVEELNAKHVPGKFRHIAKAIGMDVKGRSDEECSDYVIEAIRQLSKEVGIPEKLSELGVKDPDVELLADNAMKDACAPGNPYQPSKDEVMELFRKII
ncbi:iron-containing alcohol dehydrogenase [Paenibacillus sp. FSL H7-0942]|uniref:Iron-containing alcohol dehydrogenase n=1 Tax=Paenibacillus amylolyticus TaxID=1451 RepID=A0ABD8AZU0_PAEAM|nr:MULTISPECIES: iron-containing alcohol dehydrogenase [Paenibacillus]ETT52842.1 alcohol dehydrogenase [Paenibacillus sp. FSL H7-689]KLU54245.1 1,2-propanediol oxidoreductase [Paenibacillus sp. VT-400]MCP1426413.1 lactaldehyde reductase [Paenibacillus xylanexedens]PJN53008.1 Alcohol dehydrogenase 2 [Paenibacillus sp. GM1FR]RPK30568.1 alcohol dehydrogenase [Paenibacillus xylanexedens]